MKRPLKITTLFLDVGGVLLTNGWDRHARKRAATHYKLKAKYGLKIAVVNNEARELNSHRKGVIHETS